METLGSNIIRLRELGLSYKKISIELGCSKSIVTYHIGKGQKEKSLNRTRRIRAMNPIISRMYMFKYKKKKQEIKQKRNMTTSVAISQKISQFHREKKSRNYMKSTFNVKDVVEKFNNNPFCALTGEKLNLDDYSSYNFDHIIPVCKGGENALENLQFVTGDANRAKSGLMTSDLLALCEKILKHHGYLVEKVLTK